MQTNRFLESALSTGDPNIQALAWELDVRAATTEKNWKRADDSLQKGLAILDNFEIPVTAWRVHSTAYDFYSQQRKEAAEMHRARAEANIRALAGSFAPDEPLRRRFLGTAPVSRILYKS